MKINYLPLYGNQRLSVEDFSLVRATLQESETTLRKIPAFEKVQGVDVLVEAGPCPKDLPVLGRTWNPYLVGITVDPHQPEFYRTRQHDELPKVLAHEMHHVLRSRSVEYGPTLGAALVSEGLAQVFELETGYSESRYAKNLSKTELLAVSERARHAVLNGKDYNHEAWFLGTENVPHAKEPFKRWSGYSLGFALVSSWLQSTMWTPEPYTAATAAHLPADEILKSWLEKGNEVLKSWVEAVHGLPAERPGGSVQIKSAQKIPGNGS